MEAVEGAGTSLGAEVGAPVCQARGGTGKGAYSPGLSRVEPKAHQGGGQWPLRRRTGQRRGEAGGQDGAHTELVVCRRSPVGQRENLHVGKERDTSRGRQTSLHGPACFEIPLMFQFHL